MTFTQEDVNINSAYFALIITPYNYIFKHSKEKSLLAKVEE